MFTFQRTAIAAGVALEHLAKACLAVRSSALLAADLKGDTSFRNLVALLGISASTVPLRLRTVGLRDALNRMKIFIGSTVPEDDLQTLIDMRDGAIHAAETHEVEQRLVAAFVRQADALLADLNRDRAAFWGGYLEEVDTLLADATDRVAHSVSVKLAAARRNFAQKYGWMTEEMLTAIR